MPAILINFLMQISTIKYGGLSSGVRTLLAVFFLLVGLSAHGEIYKWTDEQGQLHFSDKAPEAVVVEAIGDQLIINSYQGSEVTTTGFLDQRDALRREKARLKRPSVVMYSAVWCGVCKSARQFFKANKIPFSEYDVETSAKGKKDFARLKGRGVPVILIGKKRMNGFDKARFKQLYGG